MLNSQQVWSRVRKLKAFSQLSEFDFRPVYFVQKFTPAANDVPTAWVSQPFPNGAIILGITASGFVPGAAANGQGNRNRQLFGIDFQFSNTDAIIVNGPVAADALLGGGDADVFPSREIIIAPSSQVNCRTTNYTTGLLSVHVAYHVLSYRTIA